eukprot:227283-Lingulodinium_polyedra.AAC.1
MGRNAIERVSRCGFETASRPVRLVCLVRRAQACLSCAFGSLARAIISISLLRGSDTPPNTGRQPYCRA